MAQDEHQHSILNAGGQAPVVLICDHASRTVPREYGNLGLPDDVIARHVGWDIGAAELTRSLSARLDAPALFSAVSRLVIDCNRAPDDPTLICEVSDGVLVPGNRGLSEVERARRLSLYHQPYHAAIRAALTEARRRCPLPGIFSIHSFTPAMRDQVPRPWHVGVLWNRDGRLAQPLIQALRDEGDLVVGDNEPYSGRAAAGFSIREHGDREDIPFALIEVRQDLISDAAGVAAWTERLERCFRSAGRQAGIAL